MILIVTSDGSMGYKSGYSQDSGGYSCMTCATVGSGLFGSDLDLHEPRQGCGYFVAWWHWRQVSLGDCAVLVVDVVKGVGLDVIDVEPFPRQSVNQKGIQEQSRVGQVRLIQCRSK